MYHYINVIKKEGYTILILKLHFSIKGKEKIVACDV